MATHLISRNIRDNYLSAPDASDLQRTDIWIAVLDLPDAELLDGLVDALFVELERFQIFLSRERYIELPDRNHIPSGDECPYHQSLVERVQPVLRVSTRLHPADRILPRF